MLQTIWSFLGHGGPLIVVDDDVTTGAIPGPGVLPGDPEPDACYKLVRTFIYNEVKYDEVVSFDQDGECCFVCRRHVVTPT